MIAIYTNPFEQDDDMDDEYEEALERGCEPAFPSENDSMWFSGMSLREWYAGKAMEALIGKLSSCDGVKQPQLIASTLARSAVQIADEMLKALDNG